MKLGETVMFGDRLKITRVLDAIYLMDDADGGTGYVVVGTERALVVDTCNGLQDYAAAVRGITELPPLVVNTHAHGDHTGGNRFFERALIGEAELPAYNRTVGSACPAEVIRDGDVVDIGGRSFEAIAFPGHTAGGICLLDRADRVMFTGDSVLGRTVWMFMDNSVAIPELRASLVHLNSYRGEFDLLLTGHSRKADDPALIDSLIECCDTVMAGRDAHPDRFGKYEVWGGVRDCCYYVGEDGMRAALVLK